MIELAIATQTIREAIGHDCLKRL